METLDADQNRATLFQDRVPVSKGPSELSDTVRIKVKGEEIGLTARAQPLKGQRPVLIQSVWPFFCRGTWYFALSLSRLPGTLCVLFHRLKWGPAAPLFWPPAPAEAARTITLKGNPQRLSIGVTSLTSEIKISALPCMLLESSALDY